MDACISSISTTEQCWIKTMATQEGEVTLLTAITAITAMVSTSCTAACQDQLSGLISYNSWRGYLLPLNVEVVGLPTVLYSGFISTSSVSQTWDLVVIVYAR